MPRPNQTSRESSVLRTILTAGITAGVLDLLAAVGQSVYHGGSALWVLQSISSGLFGKEAYDGGWRTAALGLGIHFLIATTAAAMFYLASRRFSWLIEHPGWSGPLWGVAVYLAMAWVVIPLSAIGKFPSKPSAIATGVLIHIVCVGLPIAWLIRRGEGSR